MLKILCRYQKGNEFSLNFFSFLDKFISIGCGKLSLLRREYLSSEVHVLTNSPEISDLTKRNVFQLNLFQSDKITGPKCCRADFSIVWDRLTS